MAPEFFDAAHLDIAYGDTVAPGGIKFALIIVDRKIRYTYALPLCDCKSVSLINALIITDNGWEITLHIVYGFCQKIPLWSSHTLVCSQTMSSSCCPSLTTEPK